MLAIRLARTGAKKKPFYHIVVADSRRAVSGRFNERIGYFNPVAVGNETRLHLEMERMDHWRGQGAQPSERVLRLIKDFKLGLTAPLPIKPKKKKKVEAEQPAPAAEATPAKEAKAEEVKAEEPKAKEAKAEEPKAEEAKAPAKEEKAEEPKEDESKSE